MSTLILWQPQSWLGDTISPPGLKAVLPHAAVYGAFSSQVQFYFPRHFYFYQAMTFFQMIRFLTAHFSPQILPQT